MVEEMKARKPINSAVLCERISLIFDLGLVVLIRCLLYWSMPWNFRERQGPVGSILSYIAGEVPSETGSPGQVNKL